MKRRDTLGKNKYLMLLFRLLSVKHRLVFPLHKAGSRRLDQDLNVFLAHKIVTSLKKALH